MSLEAGQVFAGYTIVRVLGSGGMGSVYLASHPRLPRQDALKVLPPDLTADPEFRARFVREAELAAGLSHPQHRGDSRPRRRRWPVLDFDGLCGRHRRGPTACANTIRAGCPSRRWSRSLPRSARRWIMRIIVGCCTATSSRPTFCWPIPTGRSGGCFWPISASRASIDDAAGLTATNMTVGTVNYAAPEQLKGEPIDGRADQYALACTAFHLLAGVPPYDDSNPAVVISRHVNAPPPSIGALRPELAGLDAVFATAMAKEPSRRFGSCAEFAEHLAQQPITGFAYADAIPFPDTQPSLDVTAPALPTPPAPPVAKPRRARRLDRCPGRHRVAGRRWCLRGREAHPAPPIRAPRRAPRSTAPTPNTGPFTGVYQVHFGPATKLDGAVVPESKPLADTYAVRSVCRPAGCVATAIRLSGEMRLASSAIFDQVGGRWVAVTLASDKCRDAPDEIWQVFTLEPRPDGTFTGDYRGAAANACAEKRTVTFTRTGDVDVNSLPDPGSLPPRVASPAEALHGRYHLTRTFANGAPSNQDGPAVITDCLRTGDRCMSYFHSGSFDTPMVFSGGNWNMNVEHDEDAPNCGGPVGVKITGQYPLPQPPQRSHHAAHRARSPE